MTAPFSPVPCPKCGEYSQPHGWNEVDIGVGAQTFDHTWVCKNHGEFADNGAFRDGPTPESELLQEIQDEADAEDARREYENAD